MTDDDIYIRCGICDERALRVLTLADRYLVWLGDPLSTDDTSWTDFKEGVIRE